jgi:hypothetical protein
MDRPLFAVTAASQEMLSLHEPDPLVVEPPPPPAPLISFRLLCTLVLLAGLVILAHGCHADEDTELFNFLHLQN